MVITELPGCPDAWPVRDELGRHYLAELAVTWYTDDYGKLVPAVEGAGNGSSA
jgi:hypothetical protein